MTSASDDLPLSCVVDEPTAAMVRDRDLLAEQLTEAELAERRLARHLGTGVGGPIKLRVVPCPPIEGTLMRVGHDHLWIADRLGFWLIVLAEVDGILGWRGGERGTVDESTLASPGLASAMRELIGRGTEVSVLVGQRWFTSQLRGIGADFAEFDDFILPLGRVRACRVWY